MSGINRITEEQVMSEIILATERRIMSEINWTTEKPDEEGWYWIRMKRSLRWRDGKTDCIGYVFRSEISMKMRMILPGYEFPEATELATHFAKVK